MAYVYVAVFVSSVFIQNVAVVRCGTVICVGRRLWGCIDNIIADSMLVNCDVLRKVPSGELIKSKWSKGRTKRELCTQQCNGPRLKRLSPRELFGSGLGIKQRPWGNTANALDQ